MQAGSSPAGRPSQAPSQVEIGERQYVVYLGAPGEPLEVDTVGNGRVCLLPWRLEDHLAALDRHVDTASGAVSFDHAGFASEVLARSGVSAGLLGELAPLALWWSLGGTTGCHRDLDVSLPRALADWTDLGGARVRLRRWTFAERERALSASLADRPDGGRELRLAPYLRMMLDASVVALDPSPMEDLHGAAAAALLDLVVALNTSCDCEEDRLVREGGDRARAFASTTLRLCGALGWTASQVWAMPAVESDRMLALLDATGGRTRAPGPEPSRYPSLRDFPDAVVIAIEGD